ncbi:hypothetical protein ACFW9X_23675, partial [Streptomyces sp. NPDC059466]
WGGGVFFPWGAPPPPPGGGGGGRPPPPGGGGAPPPPPPHDYVPRLLRALDRPQVVVPVHWDNFEEPLSAPPRRDPSMDLDAFVAQVRRASPASRIVVPDYRTVYGGDMRPVT